MTVATSPGDGDGPHHAQIDDVVAEFGVDHAEEGMADGLLSGLRHHVLGHRSATFRPSGLVTSTPEFTRLFPVVFRSMDRLPVFKALGDNTRYAIYLEVARSATPLSTAEIAEALDLHPNTVRPHLERMREAGLLEVETGGQGMVGRPQHRYSIAPDAPSLGLEPSSFRLLSRLVAGVVARADLAEDEIAAVGASTVGPSSTRTGRRPPAAWPTWSRRADGARLGPTGRVAAPAARAPAGGTRPLASCAALLARLLAELGFDPVTADDPEAVTVAFTRCPFGEIAEAFPDVVCHLHRGMVEGIIESVGGARVQRFATLADRDPCQVDLVAG